MSTAPEYHCATCGIVHEYGKHVTPKGGADELDEILQKYMAMIDDLMVNVVVNREFEFKSPLPDGLTLKQAIEAHVKREVVRELKDVRQVAEIDLQIAPDDGLMEYLDARVAELEREEQNDERD
jgi:NMD protein affecting ribosome stability and mRNA decay